MRVHVCACTEDINIIPSQNPLLLLLKYRPSSHKHCDHPMPSCSSTPPMLYPDQVLTLYSTHNINVYKCIMILITNL